MTFDEWFQEQFGRRPSDETLHTLRLRLADADAMARKAKELLDETSVWEATRNAAMYAWHAREYRLERE